MMDNSLTEPKSSCNAKTASGSEFIATSPSNISGKSEARIIGSAVAGISELALFHPVDTGTFIRLWTNVSL